jgi:hypothetical protein
MRIPTPYPLASGILANFDPGIRNTAYFDPGIRNTNCLSDDKEQDPKTLNML